MRRKSMLRRDSTFLGALSAAAAAPTWQQDDLQTVFGATSNPTVSKPANLAEGDMVLLFAAGNSADINWSAPSGFTLISLVQQGLNNPGDGSSIAAFWKIATDSEPASYQLSGGGEAAAGRVTNASGIEDFSTASGEGGELTVPEVVAVDSPRLLLGLFGMQSPRVIDALPAMSVAWNELSNDHTAWGGFYEDIAAAGGTGTRSLDQDGSGKKTGLLFLVNP